MPRRLLTLIIFCTLTACQPNTSPTTLSTSSLMVGNDRDPHGCIPSAGYVWCTRLQSCTRPWELAAAQSFPNTLQAFTTHCTTL